LHATVIHKFWRSPQQVQLQLITLFNVLVKYNIEEGTCAYVARFPSSEVKGKNFGFWFSLASKKCARALTLYNNLSFACTKHANWTSYLVS